MTNSYRIIDSAENVKITLSLPEEMVRDLARASEANGRDVSVELMIRLARSLERDKEMLAADRLMESAFRWQPATEQ